MFEQAVLSRAAAQRTVPAGRARHARAKRRLYAQRRRRFHRLGCSTIERAYQRLGALERVWCPVIAPRLDGRWLDGRALTRPSEGKLASLLAELGRGLGTDHRKIIAAAFSLRFGTAAATALGPFLIADCVPDLRLEDIALKFDAHVLLERVAFRRHCTLLTSSASAYAPHERRAVELAELRAVLCRQAEPVLHALYGWSRLKLSTLWGLLISTWGNELAKLGSALQCSEHAWDTIAQFFATDHPAFQLRPRFYVVNEPGETRICQVRASCCLNHRIADNTYCVSCPVRVRGREHADRATPSQGLSL